MNQKQRARPCLAARFLLAAIVMGTYFTPEAHAAAAHLVLIPEAPVTLIRGTSMFVVSAPVALLPGDLLATDTQPATARLEDGYGTLAGLGPQTRLAVTPRGRGGNGEAAPESLSLLSGWLKVTYKSINTAEPLRLETAALRTTVQQGSLVVHATGEATGLFVENGNVVAAMPEASGVPLSVSSDVYMQRQLGQQPGQEARPPARFINEMPAMFRDPLVQLPAHAPLLDLVPSQEQQPAFADLADWLTSPLPIRRTFVRRFRGLAQNEPFRTGIERNLRDLPDWQPVLYPRRVPSRLHRSTSSRTLKENS
jgi:hypothetical protein